MIDDHGRCEWVNISSGTGSPSKMYYFRIFLLILLLLMYAEKLIES